MKLKMASWKITLLISAFITLFGNFSFWGGMSEFASIRQEPLLFLSFFIVIFTLINLLLTLFSFKPLFKPVAILILLTSASAAYFMDNYAVMIDKSMVRNVLATDFNEANELLSLRMIITIALLGILPSWLLFKTKVIYKPFFKGLFQKGLIVVACVAVIAGALLSNYQDLSFFGREHRELRHLINPTNYLFSLKSVILKSIESANVIAKPIETDAQRISSATDDNKPNLVIMVLGETARSMNFSLNGYQRDTNPRLAKQDIINFQDVSSCGTATAVSVPCLFSKFSRKQFNHDKGIAFENVLDVIKNANYDVLWRDNNTGCQGTCKRIEFEDLAHKTDPRFCENDNCIDDILLDGLQTIVDAKDGSGIKDRFIILHQKGNHGPTYHRRYPKEFEVFKPACKTNQLRTCTQQEVVNAYDNAILYTDYFLDETINFLKKNSDKYNTAMMYVSDHGESLGENNLYLHGLPYIIAPDYQKKVPMMLWLSNNLQDTAEINKSCVANKSQATFSHDNVFSSMLGLLSIQTDVRDTKLDLFDSCRKTRLAKKAVE
jgi:lipid A ethanolaminephosphotransferase